eukprot:TRINITY_DN396_c0_g3_i1.p1 TRINITY_DN396_c0_g3~~TRINITY_DN396_c0_g3_i1.p1  ORF type:complete len:344 (+),score=42.15 TRINITY_DN396_c0_g3_i1:68-1099(+)
MCIRDRVSTQSTWGQIIFIKRQQLQIFLRKMANLTSEFRTQFEGMIHDVQYDYYGTRLAVCSQDGHIEIYDVAVQDNSKTRTGLIKAHNGPVWQVAWAHPTYGSVLASCGFDKKVTIWREVKLGDWQEVISFTDHQASVNSISFAPYECGLVLAAGSSDGQVSVLQRRQDNTWQKPVIFQAHQMGINCVSWAPFSDNEASQNTQQYKPLQRLATGSCDCSIKIWQYDAQRNGFDEVEELKGHRNWVRDIAWRPNLLGTEEVLATSGDNGVVIIWKFQNGQNPQSFQLGQFEGPTWRLSWSLTGNLLSISCINKSSGNNVYVYKENEQQNWELFSEILDEKESQ